MDRSMDEPPSVDLARLAKELGFRVEQVQNVVTLLDAGNTIPFITRYRKEKTGNLDEEQLRTIESRVRSMRQLKERATAILRLIEAQGKLTPELKAEQQAISLVRLLFEKGLTGEFVLAAIVADETITDLVRQRATELARPFADNLARFQSSSGDQAPPGTGK